MGKASRARREKIAEFLEKQEKDGLRQHERMIDRLRDLRYESYVDLQPPAIIVDGSDVYAYCIEHIFTPDFGNQPFDSGGLADCRPPFNRVFIEFSNTNFDVLDQDIYFGFGDNSYGVMLEFDALDDREGYSIRFSFFYDDCHLDSDGKAQVVLDNRGHFDILDGPQYFPYHRNMGARNNCALYAALLTLTLMNCRNVQLVDYVPSPETDKKYQQYFGKPITRHKILRINTVRKVYDTERDSNGQNTTPKSWHFVRSHPATYTDAAPLLGKLVGTFWRPAHVRGDVKRGMTSKDYDVQAPSEN